MLRREVICGFVLETLRKENDWLKSLLKEDANVLKKTLTHQIQRSLNMELQRDSSLRRKGIKVMIVMNHTNKMENEKHVNVSIDTGKVLH